MDISERNFEATIEAALLANGPDAFVEPGVMRESRQPYVVSPPSIVGAGMPALGGYRKRAPEEYDRAHCLLSRDVFDFLHATQPKEWTKFQAQHGPDARPKLLQRLSQ